MTPLAEKCALCQREHIEQPSCPRCFRYEVAGRVDLYVPPEAPTPEPVLTLKYGDEECTITYTGLHHLLNCGGWDDRHRDNLYFNEDARLARWLGRVRQQMSQDASLVSSRRFLPGRVEPEVVACVVEQPKALPPRRKK